MRDVFGEILREKNLMIFFFVIAFLYFGHCKCNILESRNLKLVSADRR